MQTSVLRFPKSDRFIRIHESLMVACDRDACAAALVTFFEGWHNYKLEQTAYTRLYNEMAEDAELASVVDISGWQYHTNAQLEAGVMVYKIDTINKALDKLESLQFISREVPDRLVMLHKTGRTRWFLLMPHKINEWFDTYERKLKPPKVTQPRLVPKRVETKVKTPRASRTDSALIVFDYWKRRCNHLRSMPDAKRLQLICDRLAEGYTVLDLCMAIEGCAANPFHKGENDRGRKFDRIDLIFRTAGDVDRFCGYAAQHQVDRAKVQSWIDNPATMQPTAEPMTLEQATKYLSSLINLVVPLLVTSNETWPVQTVRQVRVMVQGKPETLLECEPKIAERVEATEGMYAEIHGQRLRQLAGLIT